MTGDNPLFKIDTDDRLFKVHIRDGADVDDVKDLADWLKDGGYILDERPSSSVIYIEDHGDAEGDA